MQHNRLDTHGGALGYAYDNCGALRRDYNKAVTQITYDLLGNPKKVKFYGGNTTEYVYTADGIRLKTIHTTVVPGSTSSSTSQNEILSVDSTVYIGDYIEENGKFKQYNFSKKRYSMKYFFLCFCLALMPIQEIGAQRGNTISERQELSSTYALLQGVWNIYKCDSTVYVKHLTFSDSKMLILKSSAMNGRIPIITNSVTPSPNVPKESVINAFFIVASYWKYPFCLQIS